jgi:hypothetical protein
MLRSGPVLPAFQEGLRRAASAPSVAVGTFALALAAARLLGLPVAPATGFPALLANASNPIDIPSPIDYAALLATVAGPTGAWMVLWAFLSGGILDRFARNRATRGRGFFGACGAHFPAIARLEVVALALSTLVLQVAHPRIPLAIATGVVLAVHLVIDYARVRVVVEDRRSALGAILAGARFLRRNPAAILLYLFYALLILGAGSLYAGTVDRVTEPGWLVAAAPVACLLLRHVLKLALLASEIAIFQARLAHASYTAGPPLEWPESPAAEAITNLSSSAIP